jgi:outer membrane protein insertion porin family
VQFPIFGLPKDIGLRGAVFADAGTLFGYGGKTNYANVFGLPAGSACVPPATALYLGSPYPISQGSCLDLRNSDAPALRASVGASLLWNSPVGPIRFDYAFVLKKATGDVTQAFRFTGGGSF